MLQMTTKTYQSYYTTIHTSCPQHSRQHQNVESQALANFTNGRSRAVKRIYKMKLHACCRAWWKYILKQTKAGITLSQTI